MASSPPISADFGWPYLIISGIGAVVTVALTYPFSAGVTVLLYVDQRVRARPWTSTSHGPRAYAAARPPGADDAGGRRAAGC